MDILLAQEKRIRQNCISGHVSESAAYSTVILCGGRSTRMGQDKAEMKLQEGGPRMVDRLLAAFSECGEVILSVRDKSQLSGLGNTACRKRSDEISDEMQINRREGETVRSREDKAEQVQGQTHIVRVIDPLPGAGPLAGIVASLRVCRHELLFAAAVDMPFLDREFAEALLCAGRSMGAGSLKSPGTDVDDSAKKNMPEEWDVLVPAGPDGRLHPLCAFYKKSALPALEEGLQTETYSVRRCFRKLCVREVPAEILPDSGRKLTNLNRPEDIHPEK